MYAHPGAQLHENVSLYFCMLFNSTVHPSRDGSFAHTCPNTFFSQCHNDLTYTGGFATRVGMKFQQEKRCTLARAAVPLGPAA